MKTEVLPYTEGDDAFEGFIARPEAAGPHPTVLVCHAYAGRDAFADGKAKQLAELGYIGAAIDLYGVGKRGTDAASSMALMMELIGDPPLLRRRLAASFEAVRAIDGVSTERMGVIGFCFGGLCSILTARMGLPLRGVVSFHGLLKVGAPLDEKVQARILVLHGQDDPMVPPSDVGAFAQEMKRVDADWQLHAFPGVVHSFTNPAVNDLAGGKAYDADADRRSWIEMRRFFEDVFAQATP
jgi:dienelactone hydrolase